MQNSKRLRISHLIVRPVLVYDDGEELTPGPEVKDIHTSLSQLPALAETLLTELAKFESTEADEP